MVVRLLPFQRTTEPETKFVPVTVKVKAALPALIEDGLKLLSFGTGLQAELAACVTVKVLPAIVSAPVREQPVLAATE